MNNIGSQSSFHYKETEYYIVKYRIFHYMEIHEIDENITLSLLRKEREKDKIKTI